MGALRLSTGVWIPNHDMRRKSSGGRVGLPDGWGQSAQVGTDVGFGTVKLAWEPIWEGGTGAYDLPAYPYGSGRCLAFEIQAGATASASREIYSPPSPIGSFFGTEQMDRDSTGYWYYRVKALILGKVLSGGGSVNQSYTVAIDIYTSTGSRKRRTCSFTIPESDFDGTWKLRQSAAEACDATGWTAGPGTPAPAYAQIAISCAGGTGTRRVVLAVADLTIETLGPVDQGTGTGQLHASPAPNTFYELSKSPLWQGMRAFRRESMAKQGVLPSGGARTFDPAGGHQPLSFEFPSEVLTRTDYLKLTRLWRANRGYPSNPDTWFGKPVPLLLMPNQPEFVWTQGANTYAQGFYADFAGDEFPLESTGSWQRNTESSQLYRGSLRFRER